MLAEELKVSMKTIDAWECGRTFPNRLDLLRDVGRALGVDICAVLRESMDEEESECQQKK